MCFSIKDANILCTETRKRFAELIADGKSYEKAKQDLLNELIAVHGIMENQALSHINSYCPLIEIVRIAA